ncbi:unnamed protein product [Oppiella nova]|uniref:Uncharacterized protein n=1 Tax=Oppiella nova TaxID=334625 RepID=A0A7R9M4Q9_9ACAR|nr:unnamed protein product [Oppiella nova]CAG2169429.1 unnamed protein product [Oppiella nova]
MSSTATCVVINGSNGDTDSEDIHCFDHIEDIVDMEDIEDIAIDYDQMRDLLVFTSDDMNNGLDGRQLNPIECQLNADLIEEYFKPNDISKVLEIIETVDTTRETINDVNTSDNCVIESRDNNTNGVNLIPKRKKQKTSDTKSGKQLRFLFEKFGLRVNDKSRTNGTNGSQVVDNSGRIHTRSQTNSKARPSKSDETLSQPTDQSSNQVKTIVSKSNPKPHSKTQMLANKDSNNERNVLNDGNLTKNDNQCHRRQLNGNQSKKLVPNNGFKPKIMAFPNHVIHNYSKSCEKIVEPMEPMCAKTSNDNTVTVMSTKCDNQLNSSSRSDSRAEGSVAKIHVNTVVNHPSVHIYTNQPKAALDITVGPIVTTNRLIIF